MIWVFKWETQQYILHGRIMRFANEIFFTSLSTKENIQCAISPFCLFKSLILASLVQTAFSDGHLVSLTDDNGWEVCQQHLGPFEECYPGDSEEEQQWPQLWGAVQECLHNGPPQTRREAVHRPAGGCHWTSNQQSKTTWAHLQHHSPLIYFSFFFVKYFIFL